MAMRKILVDETNRELCEHGTAGFPMTVNHDDLWAFEGKSVPIHWHNDLENQRSQRGRSNLSGLPEKLYCQTGGRSCSESKCSA